jgi:hypothetical protein
LLGLPVKKVPYFFAGDPNAGLGIESLAVHSQGRKKPDLVFFVGKALVFFYPGAVFV